MNSLAVFFLFFFKKLICFNFFFYKYISLHRYSSNDADAVAKTTAEADSGDSSLLLCYVPCDVRAAAGTSACSEVRPPPREGEPPPRTSRAVFRLVLQPGSTGLAGQGGRWKTRGSEAPTEVRLPAGPGGRPEELVDVVASPRAGGWGWR